MENDISKLSGVASKDEKSDEARLLFFSLFISVVYFLLQVYFFPTDFRPDEVKARDFFSYLIVGRSFDVEAELYIRVVLYLFNIALTAFLLSIKLIDKKVLLLGAVWPLATFLFSKIYWEFYVFPLYLIKINTSIKEECFVLFLLSSLYLLTGESNLLVFLAFRCVIFGQKIGFRYLAPLGLVVLSVVISLSFESGLYKFVPFLGGELDRFAWTREVANPEYSIFETLAVFLSSLHFFTIHTGLWWIDLLFSCLVVFVVVCRSWLTPLNFVKQPEVLAFASVLFSMTEITHVFQNARYYLFFIPILAVLVDKRTIVILAWLGLLHVILKAVEAT